MDVYRLHTSNLIIMRDGKITVRYLLFNNCIVKIALKNYYAKCYERLFYAKGIWNAYIRQHEREIKQSWEKLVDAGAKVIYPGHGEPFSANYLK